MIFIRAAALEDAASIAHVHVESWRTTYAGIVPKEYLAGLSEAERTPLWREWLVRVIEVFVADDAGRICGFIGGGAIREPVQGCDAELFAIYLLEDAQRRGTGTALLRALAHSLMSKGYESMAAWVLEKNPSRHFYVKSGALMDRSMEIEIGGTKLVEVAYWWPALSAIGTPA